MVKKRGKVVGVEILKEIKRLSEDGLSQSEISKSCGVSRRSIGRFLLSINKSGVDYKTIEPMSSEELSKLLGKKLTRGESKVVEIDFLYVSRELKRKGVTLRLLWEELIESIGEDLSYSSFCNRYRRWLKAHDYSMPQVHIAGEKLFVDFSGLTVSYYPQKGVEEKAQVFVATLGASNYTFVYIVPNQKERSWIEAHIKAFEYFGGVSKLVFPDNLKSAIVKASCP